MTKHRKEITIAAVLKYDGKKDQAPTVTARGHGFMAEKILDLAKKHGVPIKNDPALAQILSRLDIDEEIPPDLYRVVAEILAFVYSVNERFRDQSSNRKTNNL